MKATGTRHQYLEPTIDQDGETLLPPLRHSWSSLGKELFLLEDLLTSTPDIVGQLLTEQEKQAKHEEIRNAIITQLYCDEGSYSRDTRYLAFLLLKCGRGGVIVGNPFTYKEDGTRQELPYTGLEGYYAGVEKTADRPGMSREEILQEEANIGAQMMKTIKRHAISHNCWYEITRLKQVLRWENQDMDVLLTARSLWGIVVRRLHVRIYHAPEFAPTLTEQIDQLAQLVGSSTGRMQGEQGAKGGLQATYTKLVRDLAEMSEGERAQEQQERRRRERLRAERIAAFHRFHNETYQILRMSGQSRYRVGVQDTSLGEAAITETITLPAVPGRTAYPPTPVHFTSEQLEGYLFLARLGAVGGDPLVRSVLVSQ